MISTSGSPIPSDATAISSHFYYFVVHSVFITHYIECSKIGLVMPQWYLKIENFIETEDKWLYGVYGTYLGCWVSVTFALHLIN